MPSMDLKYLFYKSNFANNYIVDFTIADEAEEFFGGFSTGAIFTIGPSNPSMNIFPDIHAAAAHYFSNGKGQDYVDAYNLQYGTSFTLGSPIYWFNTVTNNKFNGKFDKPTGTPSQYIRGDGSLATLPSAAAPSQSSATIAFNTGSQISTTRGAIVSYSVSIANALSLAGGAVGYVALEIATNSSFTTGLQEVARVGNGNTGTLVIGLALNDAVTLCLSGFVPANYYRRLKTVNTTGTPTYTYICGQETLI